MPRTIPPWETKREFLTKAEDHTDPKYGCKPSERSAKEYIRYGVINLDKPAGPTSHEVAAWTKKILKLEAIGHGGTLDPKVTGVLPITLEDSTKMVQALLYSGKEYVCVMKLHGDVQEDQVKRVLAEFEDEIYQRPPLRSSVKRQLRTRRIYYNEYIEMDGRNVLFKVGCEGGTYIRKLCFDVGEILGVGAHMQELRRTRAGPFTENSANIRQPCTTLPTGLANRSEQKNNAILCKFIQPMEIALTLLPKIIVRDSAVDALCHGANLTAPGVVTGRQRHREGFGNGHLHVEGRSHRVGSSRMSPPKKRSSFNHGTVAALKRVVMPRGTYPKVWRSGKKQ